MKLEFDGIQFSYGVRPVLSDVYIKNETGQVTGLLGRNGSGKSTLLRVVFGSAYCITRSVRIDGQPVGEPAFKSKKIAYLPQGPFIPSGLPLRKVLMLYRVDENEVFVNFPELLADLSLTTTELSGGRRRLFEVLLILNLPALFCLLDEPFTGLTPALIERLIAEIQIKKKEKGILITDHLYRQVLGIADNLYVISNGKTHLIRRAQDLVRHGYLSDT